jgi:hypothetical protein
MSNDTLVLSEKSFLLSGAKDAIIAILPNQQIRASECESTFKQLLKLIVAETSSSNNADNSPVAKKTETQEKYAANKKRMAEQFLFFLERELPALMAERATESRVDNLIEVAQALTQWVALHPFIDTKNWEKALQLVYGGVKLQGALLSRDNQPSDEEVRARETSLRTLLDTALSYSNRHRLTALEVRMSMRTPIVKQSVGVAGALFGAIACIGVFAYLGGVEQFAPDDRLAIVAVLSAIGVMIMFPIIALGFYLKYSYWGAGTAAFNTATAGVQFVNQLADDAPLIATHDTLPKSASTISLNYGNNRPNPGFFTLPIASSQENDTFNPYTVMTPGCV